MLFNKISRKKYGGFVMNGQRLCVIVKILALLTNNPNTPDPNAFNNKYGDNPILRAASYGHTEVVKILAPLTDTPNVPNIDGETPIHNAACNGYTEIVIILVPMTDNRS